MHHLVFEPPYPEDWVEVKGHIGRQLQRLLRRVGMYDDPITGAADQRTLRGLGVLIERENLGGRFQESEGLVDRQAVAFLLHRYAAPDRERPGDRRSAH